MKDYIKPTIEIIELRPEERLATCGLRYKNNSLMSIILAAIFGWNTKCKKVWSSSTKSS